MRVLYVEDFVAWRERIVATYLRDHDVVVCDSVHEARQRYAAHQFDVVLLDFELPDGTGAEVVEFIRGAGDTVPIIANSSSDGRNRLLLSLGATVAVGKNHEADLESVLWEVGAASDARRLGSQ